QRLIKKSILLPDDVLDSQCVRHLMESKIHTIFAIQKSFHEVFHVEYDDAERGIHFTLMIALRDRCVVVVWIEQNLVDVRKLNIRKAERDLYCRRCNKQLDFDRHLFHAATGNKLL